MTDQATPAAIGSTEGLGLVPERLNPAIAQTLERLKHVDREIWEDVEAALRGTLEDHYNPELDELDCTLLLDLLWLYRHAEPLLTGKSAVLRDAVAAERERYAELRKASEYAAHQLEKARIWNGTEWHYNPLHPLHYLSALERLRDVLRA